MNLGRAFDVRKLRVFVLPVACLVLAPALASGATYDAGRQADIDRPIPDRVDPNTGPWRSVGKLQGMEGRLLISCTGALVAPRTVLTAAHCLYSPKTGRALPPFAMHFLIGYEFERYIAHRIITGFVTGKGFDPVHPGRTRGSDWALVTLDKPIGRPNRILSAWRGVVRPGTTIQFAGYSHFRPFVLTRAPACHIIRHTRDKRGHTLLLHDCRSTHGESGAPLLAKLGNKWVIVGVLVAPDIAVIPGPADVQLGRSN